MRKRKNFLAVLLALYMVMTLLPVYALAEGDSDTLQAQIDAAGSGTTITLEKNYTESITIANGQDITLNLAENVTLTNEDGKDTITVELGGTLTIEGSGTVDNVSHQCAAIYNNGTATLNGGRLYPQRGSEQNDRRCKREQLLQHSEPRRDDDQQGRGSEIFRFFLQFDR